jgi:hypothetical protein
MGALSKPRIYLPKLLQSMSFTLRGHGLAVTRWR